jgi:hypothetical protein
MDTPEPKPPPLHPSRFTIRDLREPLRWVCTGVNVFALLRENDTASSAIKTTTELAAAVLHTILGLRN